ncbi:MAG: hypothetical protein WC483_04365 [Candidatus Paceibacterota bacterium]|jgi:hypothetical protein
MTADEFLAYYCLNGHRPGDYEILISGDQEKIRAMYERINNYYEWLRKNGSRKSKGDNFNPK